MVNENISVLKTYKPPKPGTRRIYRLLGIGVDPITKAFRCPNSVHVANQFLINDDGEPKSFAFVDKFNPSLNNGNVPSHMLGKIRFDFSKRGEISIHGDRPDMFKLDQALWFHQQNKSNVGQKWHVPPTGNQYVFERLDHAKKATRKVEAKERRIEAERIIYEYNFNEIKDLYSLVLKRDPVGLTEDEVRGELYDYVEQEDNAQALLILKDDEGLQIKKIIREAKAKKFIETGTNQTTYLWTKGKEIICTKLPRKTLDQSLMMYLVTDEGRDVLKTLKELTKVK
jgi:hypothetical protein